VCLNLHSAPLPPRSCIDFFDVHTSGWWRFAWNVKGAPWRPGTSSWTRCGTCHVGQGEILVAGVRSFEYSATSVESGQIHSAVSKAIRLQRSSSVCQGRCYFVGASPYQRRCFQTQSYVTKGHFDAPLEQCRPDRMHALWFPRTYYAYLDAVIGVFYMDLGASTTACVSDIESFYCQKSLVMM
jgi:hypothetical protein